MAGLETFVEDCLRIVAARPQLAPPAFAVGAGSLWTSRQTGRRCVVLWATPSQVCLSFDETNPKARKIHFTDDFLRLYQPVETLI